MRYIKFNGFDKRDFADSLCCLPEMSNHIKKEVEDKLKIVI